MDKETLTQLDNKIQLLIDNYQALKKKHTQLTDEHDKLKTQNSNNVVTIETLQKKLSEIEKELSVKVSALEAAEKKCLILEEKLSKYEDVTKTASSKIDDLLMQLNQL
jgi:predicted  nucleic acid-binding Zn-ribbon protein